MNPPFPSPFQRHGPPGDAPVEAPEPEPKPPPKLAAMVINNRGLVVPGDSAEVYRTVTMWLRSGLCPQSYQSAEQVFFAHQTLVSVGVNPLTYLRFTAYVKNSLVFFGDLPLTLVRLSQKIKGIPEEYFIDDTGERIGLAQKNFRSPVFGAVCEMTLRDKEGTVQRVFTVEDAKTAGKLPAKFGSPWANYCNRMLQMKARGWAIKDAFPEVLNGVPQAEYDYDMLPQQDARGRVVHAVDEACGAGAKRRDLNAIYAGDGEGA